MSHLTDPDHWRKRAEEATALADAMDDPAAKVVMHGIAKSYYDLTKRAEARAKAVRLVVVPKPD